MYRYLPFNGGVSNWLLMIHEKSQNDAQTPLLSYQRPLGLQSAESSALKFFTGCIVWFDILSSLAGYHRRLLLGPTPETGHNIELHSVCGAHNWIMILIGEIAALAHQRTALRRAIDFNAQSFEDSAQDIELRLRAQHRKVREELNALRQQYSGSPPPSLSDTHTQHTVLVVTSIFASLAAIYLQTTVTPSEVSSLLINLALQSTSEHHRGDANDLRPPRVQRASLAIICR
ncbi:hypothetical protein BKA65DRAFT_474106 [Rhexocercosporidium sp. MPI-PUGE-AT-0058]|nr:hypothetical protein BKA65DRAFT_474106 [Rhexocercosporidium sp. MPI-PUGE-AT-0058]